MITSESILEITWVSLIRHQGDDDYFARLFYYLIAIRTIFDINHGTIDAG